MSPRSFLSSMVLVVIALSAFTAVPAATPPSPSQPQPWGAIVEQANGCGRFACVIEQWPADGRLAIPAGFPQIIAVTRATVDGDRESVPVEYNADATRVAVLLPKAGPASMPTVIALDTADDTTQFADGRIVFTARDARVEGTRAKLETHPGNHRIGFWTDASESVHWSRAGTRWGMYDVWLTFSTASPDGTEIEVRINDKAFPLSLRSTGSWYRYHRLPVGRVYLPSAGSQTVSVHCTKKVGGAVMNLKGVTLEPACEGTPPVQSDDGSITLHGRDATVRGTTLRYEPAEKKQTLGFWTKATDAAEWTFTVATPGSFDVEVLQGCGTGQGGSTMAVAFDATGAGNLEPITFVVEDTGGFQAFKPRIVGRVNLATGRHTLRVQPQAIAKAAACDIRQIRLLPVATGQPASSP
ncbi:MAG: hypothetical protein WCC69_01495 [Pirellulales bacterium]